jgi:type II secretory pathway pseudopilin PulG
MVTRRLPEPGKIGRESSWDRERGEGGYVLVAVVFMMAILVLSLSVAIPRLRQDIQRDRELETLQRGKQYIRAVKLYYRKFHRYPPTVEALENTENIRFLRKRYVDPITGKDDWLPIQFGQNKVPMMGLFGQPINDPGLGAGTGINGSQSSSSSKNSTSTFKIGYSGANSSSMQNATNSQAFGGAGIIGVSIPSDKVGILHYKLQDHYSLWEFVYDASQEFGHGVINSPVQGSGVDTGSNGPPNSNPPGQPPQQSPPPAFEPTD